MSIDLTPIFQALIFLLASLVTYRLIPYIKSKTNAQQQTNLAAAAKVAVFAAEQVFGAGNGAAKLEYAKSALAKAGFNLQTEMVAEAIEKAVHMMNISPFTSGGFFDTADEGVENHEPVVELAESTTDAEAQESGGE